MVIVQKIKYEPNFIKGPKDISSEKVYDMFKEVRTEIGILDKQFSNKSLLQVLEIIEQGKYMIEEKGVLTKVDLSSARGIINAYREDSDEGCRSCIHRKTIMICPPDSDQFNYCDKSELDRQQADRRTHNGFSPKIKKHYNSPCNDWKPILSPTLEKLFKED